MLETAAWISKVMEPGTREKIFESAREAIGAAKKLSDLPMKNFAQH